MRYPRRNNLYSIQHQGSTDGSKVIWLSIKIPNANGKNKYETLKCVIGHNCIKQNEEANILERGRA